VEYDDRNDFLIAKMGMCVIVIRTKYIRTLKAAGGSKVKNMP